MSVLSLVVFVLVVLIAVRSMFARDEVYFNAAGHFCILGSFPRHVHLIVCRPGGDPRGRAMEFHLGQAQYVARPEYVEVRFTTDEIGNAWRISVPHWLMALVSAPLPGWWVAAIVRRRRRVAQGLCPTCGYDMRATPERCPECGAAPPGAR